MEIDSASQLAVIPKQDTVTQNLVLERENVFFNWNKTTSTDFMYTVMFHKLTQGMSVMNFAIVKIISKFKLKVNLQRPHSDMFQKVENMKEWIIVLVAHLAGVESHLAMSTFTETPKFSFWVPCD